MSMRIIGPSAPRRSISLPAALEARLDGIARRLAVEWAEPLAAVRRLVELGALTRGLRSIESERRVRRRRCA